MRLASTFGLLLGVMGAGCASNQTQGTLALAANGTVRNAPAAAVIAPPGWRGTATREDAARIDGLAGQWNRAISDMPTRMRSRVAAEGRLLEPGAALEAPALTPGSYHCRLVRLGGRRGVASYAPDFCYIENSGGKLSFTKQTGQNLPGGWLFEDGEKRLVFLGTKRPPKDAVAPPYGEEAARDVAGVIERVAPFRWRMVLPKAGGDGDLDIYELTPAVAAAPVSPGAAAR